MSYLRIVLIICTLLPALVSRGQQQRAPVLDRIISVHADDRPVSDLLEQITLRNGIFFSYDASLITTDNKITLHLEQRSVHDVLTEIFKDDDFRFLGKNDHIIISAGDLAEGEGTEPALQLPEPVILISGKVIDSSTREPMNYVSVSLQNQPVGTITNADGDFILKLHPEYAGDTLIFSSLGYARKKMSVNSLHDGGVIPLRSISIRIREVRVKAVSVDEILDNLRENITRNYSSNYQLFSGFYRETLRQDDAYINVSEAALEILKAPYGFPDREDKVRLLKARKSPDVQPFHWVNFKMQGGPYIITMLDVIRKLETFLDPDYQLLYRYSISQVIWYKNHPVFVIRFRPARDIDFPLFVGEMYVDRESYALLYASFSLDEYGLSVAGESLIRKKPKEFRVKPLFVDYQVDFSEHGGIWYLHTARANVAFRVKSPKDKINSVFHTVSDLLITEVRNTSLKRFPVKELFTVNDIFSEISIDYDEDFWDNYNIIKPDEDLQKAVKHFTQYSTGDVIFQAR
ncbi:MAG TPA: carboxypeptidase-like regulatory domain-containing protein [Prolixibacteraceae bacterium]|nr:carboxypeptidase-like regulatory domain-containing protein [Prolixibacteraceae bacterium]HOS00265.1 carboxypeptidase-like regulatory domain-containing protein [Prolixibacteraceae bacterium]HPL45664.1 carboxypeptidase-like regulatory domain-containing protein [Prolixibacteraceae bacterium]